MDDPGPVPEEAPAPLVSASCVDEPWAGLPPGPGVMGVLNVTPDSFSDGGRLQDVAAAVAAGVAMAEAGAVLVDVGGESTRPRAAPVDVHEELSRVVPVVAGLARAGVRVSIDTRRAKVMAAALDAGAAVVNDVSGLTADCCSARVVARAGCPVILMHMRGTPATMLSLAQYDDVLGTVLDELRERVRGALDAGVLPARIALDPGIGFAKDGGHNAVLLRGLPALCGLGYPMVVGVSRKAFIGHLTKKRDPAARIVGSLSAGLFAVSRGASLLRVHDVADTVEALHVWQALAVEGGRTG